MTRKARSAASSPDFEKKLQDLETLVGRLERGDLPLSESLALFEQGVALTRECHAALGDARQRVEILLKDSDHPQRFDTATDEADD